MLRALPFLKVDIWVFLEPLFMFICGPHIAEWAMRKSIAGGEVSFSKPSEIAKKVSGYFYNMLFTSKIEIWLKKVNLSFKEAKKRKILKHSISGKMSYKHGVNE